MLFGVSILSTIVYFSKVYILLFKHKFDFNKNRVTFIIKLNSKIHIVAIFTMLSTWVIFLTRPARVCAGLGLTNDETTTADWFTYLYLRSRFFMFVGFIGFCQLVVFIYFAIRDKQREKKMKQNSKI